MVNVEVMSREAMEQQILNGFPVHTAVISFYDPSDSKIRMKDYKPLDYSNVCDYVFMVPIHDIDIEILEQYGLSFETYFPEADELAQYIKMCVSKGMNLICQCEYGQSRSAACAAAIREYYDKSGIEIFADYRYYPNQLIFNKMLEALRK